MSTSDQNPSPPGEITMAVIGCGTMGIAILSGILTSLASPSAPLPPSIPTRFIAAVRSPASAARVTAALSPLAQNPPVQVLHNSNLAAIQSASIILLACKPYLASEILSAPGIAAALTSKTLISILAGVTTAQLTALVPPSVRVIRAMPNTASVIRESMTVLATPLPDAATAAVAEWIFSQVGAVVQLPASSMDASTALCGSGPAFFALVLEAAVDGAVAMGLPRAEAQRMAAQTMKGAAAMVLGGEHPALLREKVTTPGGCTIGGLLVLEEGRVRGTVARAVREATVVAGELGKGVQGVNGTRFAGGAQL
ncbi:putative pyrroline-5-carboxylate reductase [Podospora conica]|nr:putative pyrroline-5-carboxylate reductase [Schizothecium conicum]